MKHKRISKTLSLVLRHRPEKFGLDLDTQGWCKVDQLIQKFQEQGFALTRTLLEQIVSENDKQRFAFSEDGLSIRANQGHSISIDLAYEASTPPAQLFHGTATKYLASILANGLNKRQRHHVHLSAERETAIKVGQRHGKVVLLSVDTQAMQKDGFTFFRSQNGVWLTEEVPPQYLETLLA